MVNRFINLIKKKFMHKEGLTESLNERLKSHLREILIKIKLPIEEKIELTTVKNPKFGDLSTNLALVLAKKLKEDPLGIAEKIVASFDKKILGVDEIRIETPGFINFYINLDSLKSDINQILNKGTKESTKKIKETIIIEYLSSNPTGFLHVGHARNAVVGGTLARVFKYAGYKVVSDFYINDAGNQIKQLAESVYQRYLELRGKNFQSELLSYGGEDIIECAKEFSRQKKYLNINTENKQKLLNLLADFSVNYFLKDALEDASKLKAEFDFLRSEKDIYKEGKVDQCFLELRESGQVIEKEGAFLLKSDTADNDKDRVLKRSDGRYTYVLPDIAYHKEKLTRFSDLKMAINIFGSDHIGYIKRLVWGLTVLNLPAQKLKFLIIQQVKLVKDGKEYKMSKRRGETVWLKDLVKLVGEDAAIFSLLNRSLNSSIEIDIKKLKTSDLTNPIYSIQYSYARAKQILKKSSKNQFRFNGSGGRLVKELVNLILNWPNVVEDTIRTLKPELISNYCLKLANKFNSFYSQVRVIGSKEEDDLLAIVNCFSLVMEKVMKIIGIKVLEEVNVNK